MLVINLQSDMNSFWYSLLNRTYHLWGSDRFLKVHLLSLLYMGKLLMQKKCMWNITEFHGAWLSLLTQNKHYYATMVIYLTGIFNSRYKSHFSKLSVFIVLNLCSLISRLIDAQLRISFQNLFSLIYRIVVCMRLWFLTLVFEQASVC